MSSKATLLDVPVRLTIDSDDGFHCATIDLIHCAHGKVEQFRRNRLDAIAAAVRDYVEANMHDITTAIADGGRVILRAHTDNNRS